MSLESLLQERRDAVISRWFDRVAGTYPAETAGFLKREGNEFGNPVGATISRGLNEIYDELLAGADADAAKLRGGLDRVIRIRSVQDFTASQAVVFVFQIKDIVREALPESSLEERRAFDVRVDDLALLAFDVYTECREQLHEIRTKEISRRSGMLMERAKSGDIHK